MYKEEYRVVCSKPQFSNEIFIDIAPCQGTTHDQIFFSRQKIYRLTDNRQLERLFGSIYLQDIDGKIKIDFPTDVKNNTDYLQQHYDELHLQIINCYRQMKDSLQNSTLHIYDSTQINAQLTHKSKFINNPYIQKHCSKCPINYPQNLQQEQLYKEREAFNAVSYRRKIAQNNRALLDSIQDPIERMKAKMQQYDGD